MPLLVICLMGWPMRHGGHLDVGKVWHQRKNNLPAIVSLKVPE